MTTMLRAVEQAIDHAFDRIGEADAVETLLARIAAQFGGNRAMTFAPIAIADNPLRPFGHGMPDGFFDAYAQFIGDSDLWRTAMLQNYRRLLRRGGSLSHELVDVPTLMRTPFYADQLRPMDVFAKVCAVLDVGADGGVQTFTVLRERAQGNFKEEHLQTLRAVAPRLRRLVQLQSRLVAAQETSDRTRRGLDQLVFGLLQVAHDGTVWLANLQAREWLGWSRPLRFPVGPSCRPADARASCSPESLPPLQRLHAELHRLCTEARTAGHACARIAGAAGRRDLLATAAPIAGPGGADLVQICLAPDGPAGAAGSDDRMRLCGTLYRLTPTEQLVAGLLLAGATPEDVAIRLQVRLSTVRSHLGALFAKTGTARQAELVQRLMQPVAQRQLYR